MFKAYWPLFPDPGWGSWRSSLWKQGKVDGGASHEVENPPARAKRSSAEPSGEKKAQQMGGMGIVARRECRRPSLFRHWILLFTSLLCSYARSSITERGPWCRYSWSSNDHCFFPLHCCRSRMRKRRRSTFIYFFSLCSSLLFTFLFNFFLYYSVEYPLFFFFSTSCIYGTNPLPTPHCPALTLFPLHRAPRTKI